MAKTIAMILRVFLSTSFIDYRVLKNKKVDFFGSMWTVVGNIIKILSKYSDK